MVTDLNVVRICTPLCAVKALPDEAAQASSEMLFGEPIEILHQEGPWAKIRALVDGYEGYVLTSAYDSTNKDTTHWINARATFVFETADIKAPVVHRLLFGSVLSLSDCEWDQNFKYAEDLGYIWAGHCQKKNDYLALSLIEIAEQRYLDAPYLWGGRSTDGCDCSGLVQMLAKAKGVDVPRDSGDQERALPVDVDYDNRAADHLVYWPGHVGVLKTPSLLLHSTAHTLRCCIEPLQDVIDRAGIPSSIKQLG